MNDSLPPQFERYQRGSLIVGLVVLALCVAGGFHNSTQFFRSYLVAFIFWTGVGLGCMAILMLHHMVGGTWGFALRRLLESGSKTLPLMGVLVIPLLLSLPKLYSWATPAGAAEAASPFKHVYLSRPFFLGRTVLYFVVWIALAYILNKWSADQDRTGEPGILRRLQNLSGPGLLAYGLTVTYASVDWAMSLQPEFFSTIYGMIFMVTQALSAMALVTVMVMLLSDRKPLSGVVTPLLFNDFGNLLLTFTMLWAYLSFSQYLIIWEGNLQDEIPWYVVRAEGGWAWVALALIIFHFAIPFVLLLMRFIKRRKRILAAVAAGLVVMSVVDIYWLTVPAFERRGPEFHLLDWGTIIGMGGLWMWLFLSQLKAKPLLPLHDPRLEEALPHG
ncbi:MAG: hypothetical protein LAP13_18810 [Acidobacteriia bacterium]|nr:hypothetical protein [Terriglobia bacterium]